MGALRPRSAARPRPGRPPRFQLAAQPEPGFTLWHRRAELNRTAVTPARGRYYDSLFSLRSEWHPLSRENRRHGGTGKFFRQGPQKRCAPLPRAVWRASVFSFHADSLVCLQQLVGSFKVPSRLSLWHENACALLTVVSFWQLDEKEPGRCAAVLCCWLCPLLCVVMAVRAVLCSAVRGSPVCARVLCVCLCKA